MSSEQHYKKKYISPKTLHQQ